MAFLRFFQLLLCLFALAGVPSAARAAEKPFETTSSDKKFFLFFSPAPTKADSAAQLAHGKDLIAKGSLKRAAKELNYLVLKWPGSPEAAEAQWLRATTLEALGKRELAFDEYQTLLARYGAESPYQQVLTNQWRIAQAVETRRKAAFFLFKGFTTPEASIPLYETIVGNAPSWERAPELLYRIGEIQHGSWKTEEAIKTFNRIVAEYPSSPYAEKAAFAKAQCSLQLAEEYPNHEEHTRAAWADVTFYLTHFETRNHTMQAMKMQSDLRAKLARFAFEKAEFYDRVVKTPEAALVAYEAFVREYPVSAWTERAKARIAALRPNPVPPSGSNEKI
jgi:outer membrane protein assembly factor BamD